jgi:hypothetical protein
MNIKELIEHRDRTDMDIRNLSKHLETNCCNSLYSNQLIGSIEDAHAESCNAIADLIAQVDSLTEELRDAEDYIDSNL